MLEDRVDVHRLVWSPDDVEEGKLLPTAFRRSDLEGGNNYISVSHFDEIDISVEQSLAERQATKANGKSVLREEAYSTLFNCGDVRLAQDAEGVNPLDVTREPLKENPAHCGIRNVTNNASRSYVSQLRLRLAELAKETQKFAEFNKNFKS